MSWATWTILVVYLALIALSIGRRHPPVVLGVLIPGMLACVARMFVEQAWLSVVSVGLLLLGTVLFGWGPRREPAR